MSAQEQLQLDIVVKVFSGSMTRGQGQQILNISERTLRRYLRDYWRLGVLFVKHGNCETPPVNRHSVELKQRVQSLVRDKYFDFNMTHCLEKLKADEGIEIKRETFRHWCHEIKMVKKAKRRAPKVRRRRERMQQTGLMLQMDGSPHQWFGGKPSCLIAAIDDADSDVPFGEFFPAEDTISCMRVLQEIIRKRGIFQILYVDRAGIFGGPKRSNFSQVKRALKELGIHVVFANSPEAKGRIERLWGTLQDRLIPEMRIRNITSYEAANEFLQEQFLPNEYANKFKVIPANLQTAYKPLPTGINLSEIFCLKIHRSVNRDHTYSWNNEIYRINSPLKHSIHKQKIEIRTYQDLSTKVFFAGKELQVSVVRRPEKAVVVAEAAALTPRGGVGDVVPIAAKQTVRKDGHVECFGRYYSVDEKYIGSKVSAVAQKTEVFIYFEGQIIEKHARLTGPYQRNSTKPEHKGPWRRAMEQASIYRRASQKLGKNVDQFVLMILERGAGFVDNQTIWGVLGFEKICPPEVIDEACEWALQIEAPTYRAVKSYLKLRGYCAETMKKAANA
jgi:transposase